MRTRPQFFGARPRGRSRVLFLFEKQGQSRRVLGDIGNLVKNGGYVNDPKLQQMQISRPMTRYFKAQLCNNQPAAANPSIGATAVAANPSTGATAANPSRGATAANPSTGATAANPLIGATATTAKPSIGGAAAKNTKPVLAKPKPKETELGIRPAPKEFSNTKEFPDVLPERKVNSLTSVLCARSKVASGISDESPAPVLDIDAGDQNNYLAEPEYVNDLYVFYKTAEKCNRPGDYMGSQIEINAKMREILADWLICAHGRFNLMPESLFLAFNVIDRYLTLKTVLRKEFQVIGVAALSIATKYEEIFAPEMEELINIGGGEYSRDQVLMMERRILDELKWSISVPTAFVFLVRFLKAARADQELEYMAFFLAELGLMHYSMVRFVPSMQAAAAVYAARCTLNKLPPWSATLEHYSGYSAKDIKDAARQLAGFHAMAWRSKLKNVFTKYSSPELGGVAMRRPGLRLLEESNQSPC